MPKLIFLVDKRKSGFGLSFLKKRLAKIIMYSAYRLGFDTAGIRTGTESIEPATLSRHLDSKGAGCFDCASTLICLRVRVRKNTPIISFSYWTISLLKLLHGAHPKSIFINFDDFSFFKKAVCSAFPDGVCTA